MVKALISQVRDGQTVTDGKHQYHGPERALTDESVIHYVAYFFLLITASCQRLYQAQDRFREALCDSFDTPRAVNVLRDLVSRTNVYINSRANEVDAGIVERVARWVGGMLRVFGLGEGDPSELGWGQPSHDGTTSVNVSCTPPQSNLPSPKQLRYAQREEVVMPYLRVLSSFRDGVRQLAISKGDGATKEILALCDKLRDIDLVPLGVALDDQEGRSCLDS